MRRTVFILTVLVFALIAVNQAVADPPEKTRTIELEKYQDHWAFKPEWAAGNKIPRASVAIHFWGNSSPPNPTSSNMIVKGLRQQTQGRAYALHWTPRESPAEYVHGEMYTGRFLFNVDLWHQVYDNRVVMRNLGDNPDTITMFIVLEHDDGRPFMPHLDMHDVLFVGTSRLE